MFGKVGPTLLETYITKQGRTYSIPGGSEGLHQTMENHKDPLEGAIDWPD